MSPTDRGREPGPHNPTDRSDEELVARLVELHGEGDGAPTAAQWHRLLADPDTGPLQVVYLVRFRELAAPSDPDHSRRTGAEAFFQAGMAIREVIEEVGGTPILGGFVRGVAVDAGDERWDYVGAARYPTRAAFIRLWLDDRFVAAGVLRRAATAAHRLLLTRPIDVI